MRIPAASMRPIFPTRRPNATSTLSSAPAATTGDVVWTTATPRDTQSALCAVPDEPTRRMDPSATSTNNTDGAEPQRLLITIVEPSAVQQSSSSLGQAQMPGQDLR